MPDLSPPTYSVLVTSNPTPWLGLLNIFWRKKKWEETKAVRTKKSAETWQDRLLTLNFPYDHNIYHDLCKEETNAHYPGLRGIKQQIFYPLE